MANGTSDEKVARADRIAEQSRLAQAKAKQEQQATANALANMRRLAEPGTEPYRAEMDSVDSTVTAPWGTAKVPLPRTARLVIGVCVGIGLGAILVAAAIVAVLKVLPR